MKNNPYGYWICPYCKYNNAKKRLEWKKQCLGCGHQLRDSKIAFRVKLLKSMKEGK